MQDPEDAAYGAVVLPPQTENQAIAAAGILFMDSDTSRAIRLIYATV